LHEAKRSFLEQYVPKPELGNESWLELGENIHPLPSAFAKATSDKSRERGLVQRIRMRALYTAISA